MGKTLRGLWFQRLSARPLGKESQVLSDCLQATEGRIQLRERVARCPGLEMQLLRLIEVVESIKRSASAADVAAASWAPAEPPSFPSMHRRTTRPRPLAGYAAGIAALTSGILLTLDPMSSLLPLMLLAGGSSWFVWWLEHFHRGQRLWSR
jgi:hypothetical protein